MFYFFFHFQILIGMTLTKRCWFSLNRSLLKNSQTICRHLRGVCALRTGRLRRRKVSQLLLVFSLCDTEILGYGPGEVQYVILSKALIPSACTSISFEFLYDVCLNPITSPMHPSTNGFAVFYQSLWAFFSVVRMLNYKEHEAALFQCVVCYSATIKCLY